MYCFGFRLCCRVMKDHLISLYISCWVLHICLGKNDLLHLTRNEGWGEFLPRVPVSKGWIVSATRGTITAKKKSCPQRYETGNVESHYCDLITTERKYFQVTNLAVNSFIVTLNSLVTPNIHGLKACCWKQLANTDFSEEIEVTSVYDSDINAAQVSMQLLILGTRF